MCRIRCRQPAARNRLRALGARADLGRWDIWSHTVHCRTGHSTRSWYLLARPACACICFLAVLCLYISASRCLCLYACPSFCALCASLARCAPSQGASAQLCATRALFLTSVRPRLLLVSPMLAAGILCSTLDLLASGVARLLSAAGSVALLPTVSSARLLSAPLHLACAVSCLRCALALTLGPVSSVGCRRWPMACNLSANTCVCRLVVVSPGSCALRLRACIPYLVSFLPYSHLIRSYS